MKKFANTGEVMKAAFAQYAKEVNEGTFPSAEHCYTVDNDVIEKLY